MFHQALVFACKAHSAQKRKGTNIPYIVHPMEAADILRKQKCCEEIIIAALLHDTVEDTDVTLADIENVFGRMVAEIVKGCSEPNKDLPWIARKSHSIDYLKFAIPEVRIVALADKLSNIRAIYNDMQVIGDAIWVRFKAGRIFQEWYYKRLVDNLAFRSGHDLQGLAPIWSEFKSVVDKVFGNGTLPHLFNDPSYYWMAVSPKEGSRFSSIQPKKHTICLEGETGITYVVSNSVGHTTFKDLNPGDKVVLYAPWPEKKVFGFGEFLYCSDELNDNDQCLWVFNVQVLQKVTGLTREVLKEALKGQSLGPLKRGARGSYQISSNEYELVIEAAVTLQQLISSSSDQMTLNVISGKHYLHGLAGPLGLSNTRSHGSLSLNPFCPDSKQRLSSGSNQRYTVRTLEDLSGAGLSRSIQPDTKELHEKFGWHEEFFGEHNCKSIDFIAFYCPYHNHGENYGIYINALKFALFVVKVMDDTGYTFDEAKEFALDLILTHEMFHYLVEVYTTSIEYATGNFIIYSNYNSLYQKEWGTPACLEETLANHYYRMKNRNLDSTKSQFLAKFFFSQIDGYKQAAYVHPGNECRLLEDFEQQIITTRTVPLGLSQIRDIFMNLPLSKLSLANTPIYMVDDTCDSNQFVEIVEMIFPEMLKYIDPLGKDLLFNFSSNRGLSNVETLNIDSLGKFTQTNTGGTTNLGLLSAHQIRNLVILILNSNFLSLESTSNNGSQHTLSVKLAGSENTVTFGRCEEAEHLLAKVVKIVHP